MLTGTAGAVDAGVGCAVAGLAECGWRRPAGLTAGAVGVEAVVGGADLAVEVFTYVDLMLGCSLREPIRRLPPPLWEEARSPGMTGLMDVRYSGSGGEEETISV